MKKNIQIIITILGTFALLFATSFLLDLQIVASSIIRQILVILLLLIEASIGFLVLKDQI